MKLDAEKVQEDKGFWLNINQLCEYLPDKPARQTVYGWTSAKTIPFHKKGRKLMFLKSEIDEWLKEEASPNNSTESEQAALLHLLKHPKAT